MTTTTVGLDAKRYSRLLANAQPTVIKSETENDRLLQIIEKLMAKGEDRLTLEEDAVLELLSVLVHDFERKQYAHTPSPENAGTAAAPGLSTSPVSYRLLAAQSANSAAPRN